MASRPHGLPGGSPPDRMRCGDYNGSAPRQRETEERHDSLGARRALGGGGGHFGAPHVQRDNRNRGAPRFTRGATSGGGRGGPFRGPPRQLVNRTAGHGSGPRRNRERGAPAPA